MFHIPAGTPAKLKRAAFDITERPGRLREFKTTKDLSFLEAEVVIAPLGRVTLPEPSSPAMASLGQAGFYGFQRQGWVLLVRWESVRSV